MLPITFGEVVGAESIDELVAPLSATIVGGAGGCYSLSGAGCVAGWGREAVFVVVVQPDRASKRGFRILMEHAGKSRRIMGDL
ncbi:hypothetical protein ACWCRF_27490 [Streptomyces sp. NPDC002405]|uniref:hypothetical protein n=1 Tax=Streptomyces sp. NPDC001231 TaxID=3364549 RepID=UPI003683B80C